MDDLAPRSYLTPADRDAAAFEESRLRAMALRREAVGVFWTWVGGVIRRAASQASVRIFGRRHKGA
jgi:hypothetical protein